MMMMMMHNARVLRHRIQPNCKLRSLHTRWLDSWTRPPKSGAASRNPFFICGHVVLVPHAQLVTDVTSVAIKLHGKNGAHSVCSFTQEDKNDFWFLFNRLSFFQFPFSALTLLVVWQEGHLTCEKLSVGLLTAMIWLQLCTSYSSSCHHHFHHP